MVVERREGGGQLKDGHQSSSISATPPVIPTLQSDDDTSHFEDVDDKEANPADNFQIPKAFAGNQLPFVGFTYSQEYR